MRYACAPSGAHTPTAHTWLVDTCRQFLHRAFHSRDSTLFAGRLFCVLRVGTLSESHFMYLFERVVRLNQSVEPRDYRVALLCEQEEQHRVPNDMRDFVKTVEPFKESDMRAALPGQREVLVVTSDLPGLGKTAKIGSMASEKGLKLVTVDISGQTTREELVQVLSKVLHPLATPAASAIGQWKEANAFGFPEVQLQDDEHTQASSVALHINILGVPTTCADLVNDMLFELICLSTVVNKSASPMSLIHVPCAAVYIELANVLGPQILELLPVCSSFEQLHLSWDIANNPLLGSQDVTSAVQVVANYLQLLQTGQADRVMLTFAGRGPQQEHLLSPATIAEARPLTDAACLQLLQTHCFEKVEAQGQQCSFTLLDNFVRVLAAQLNIFTETAFFRVDVLAEQGMDTARSVVLHGLVDASVKFCIRAVPTARVTAAHAQNEAARIAARLNVQRFESVNYLLLLMQADGGLTPFYRRKVLFEQGAPHVAQYYKAQSRRDLPEFESMPQDQLLQELANFLGPKTLGQLQNMRHLYALTGDNLLKMMLVHVRLAAGLPVVISGETGCGKTSLVKFLASAVGLPDERFRVLNVHAGIDKSDVSEFIRESELQAADGPVWCFLDEVNTSQHIGLFSQLVCHRMLMGVPVAANLAFICAVNPHRTRAREAETVGLQFKLNTADPMRRLVYRVHPLPETMLDFVWDYGRLGDAEETRYIATMLSGSLMPQLEATLVVASQQFIREVGEDCSVSLRDVRRFMRLVTWFYEMLQKRGEADAKEETREDTSFYQQMWQTVTRPRKKRGHREVWGLREIAIVLALTHCYLCRLPSTVLRGQYRELISHTWHRNVGRFGLERAVGPDEFERIVEQEQLDLLDRMVIPDGIAKNGALLENVFILMVCILLRMSAFLVGKPGCSKSLAMQLIFSNLRGKDSHDLYFQILPQLFEFRFQCSEDTTSEGLLQVFDRAAKFGRKNPDSIAVVLLDEVGLAEVARHNPLKVLHGLIEPDARREFAEGTADAGILPYAVVGISNWELDAAKMNRAVVLSRPDPDAMALERTAAAIMQVGRHNPRETSELLRPIARAYYAYLSQQERTNFHGLRDFYALVKTLGRAKAPGDQVVVNAVARNFGGLANSADTFQSLLDRELYASATLRPPARLQPSCIDLVCESLRDPRARHLMLITRGDEATCLLKLPQIKEALHDPVVMLASKFKADLGEEHAYQQLSKIILYMHSGRMLIIKDHDHIYGALYDMLNQNYKEKRTGPVVTRNCRVALGDRYNPHCHVHEFFRCIMLEEERDIAHSDPPRLNRCEKQRLSYQSVLDGNGLQLLDALKSFCIKLSTLSNRASRISLRDAFCGFDEDTLPSLLVRVLHFDNAGGTAYATEDVMRACKEALLDLMPCDAVVRAESSMFAEDPEHEGELQVLVARYFTQPYHAGLADCMSHFWPNLSLLKDGAMSDVAEPVTASCANRHDLLILTFTGYTSSVEKILDERGLATEKIRFLHLVNFNSEARLRDEVDAFWSEKDQHQVLLVQCEASLHAEHLLLLREIMREYEAHFRCSGAASIAKEQAIILHLRRFEDAAEWQFSCLSEWKQVVVDRLEGNAVDFELVQAARRTSNAADLVTNRADEKLPLPSLQELIQEQLSWCLSRIQYPHRSPRETAAYTLALVQSLRQRARVLDRMEGIIRHELAKQIGGDNGGWLVDLACDQGGLIRSSNLTASIIECVQTAVRKPLALLLFQLEKSSALASLQTLESDEMETMWLELWVSANREGMVLDDAAAATELGVESLRLQMHTTTLSWAFSHHFAQELQAHRARFEEMCKVQESEEEDSDLIWDGERVVTMKHGLCRHFVSDSAAQPTLRRLSELLCPAAGRDECAEAELSEGLERLWMAHSEQFAEDFSAIVADQVARDHNGLDMQIVSRVVRMALVVTLDHPADVVIRYWQSERVMRPLLRLCLLLAPSEKLPGPTGHSIYEFAARVIGEAASFCLESLPSVNDLGNWLSKAQQCTNHALALHTILTEEGCQDDGDEPHLQQLKTCKDLCTHVVIPHLVGYDLAASVAQGMDATNLEHALDALQESLQSDSVAAATAVETFKFRWVAGRLQNATSDEQLREICAGTFTKYLRNGSWAPGCVPAVVAVALRTTFLPLGLMDPYNPTLGEARFDGLTDILTEAVRDDSWLAALACSILQANFVLELRPSTEEPTSKRPVLGEDAEASAAKRHRRETAGGQLVEDTMSSQDGASQVSDMRKRPRFDCSVHTSSGTGSSLGVPLPAPLPEMENQLANFALAFAALRNALNQRRPSSIYHLAFVKAFLQVNAPVLRRRMPSDGEQLLFSSLCSLSNRSQSPEKELQDYLLKELRKKTPIEQLLVQCKTGVLGERLPFLKQIAELTETVHSATVLGYDPFVTCGMEYQKTREALQASWDDPAFVHQPLLPKMVLFATAAALYLPRSLQANETAKARRTIGRLNEFVSSGAGAGSSQHPIDDHTTRVCNLSVCLAANDFVKLIPRSIAWALEITPQSDAIEVFTASLAMHLAGILTPDLVNICPFAAYAFSAQECQQKFIVAAASNQLAVAMRALSEAVTRYRCSCGFEYFVGDCGNTSGTGVCPQCKNPIGNAAGGGYHNVAAGQTRLDAAPSHGQGAFDEPGYVQHDAADLASMTYTIHRPGVQPLSAASFRVLHLLVHLSLLVGPLLQYQGLDALLQAGDSMVACWQLAVSDFRMLGQLLTVCTLDQLSAFLHQLVEQLPEWCRTSQLPADLLNMQLRSTFEGAFASALVEPHLPNLQQAVRQALAKYSPADTPRPILHRLIDEDLSVDRAQLRYPNLFSIVLQPSNQTLRSVFDSSPGNATHQPFLALFLNQLDLISLAQHLWPLLAWERLLREHWGNELSREDSQQQSVGWLLQQAESSDPALHQRAEVAFNAFEGAWNAIVLALKSSSTGAERRYRSEADCHPIEPKDMPLMSMAAKVSLCCVDDKLDSDGNLLRLFLIMLAQAQNEFLARVVPLVGKTMSLQSMRLSGDVVDMGSPVALARLQKSHMLLDDLDWLMSSMLAYGLNQPGWGRGKEVHFSFEVIEWNLAMQLLVGTTFVDMEAFRERFEPFPFQGEVLQHHTDLLRMVGKVVPQEPVVNVMKLRDSPFLQETKNASAALALVETIMFSCTKSLPDRNESLEKYCIVFSLLGGAAEVSRVLQQCDAIRELRLKHLCSLYEVIEDMVADAVIHTTPDRFRQPLVQHGVVSNICYKIGSLLAKATASHAAAGTTATLAGHTMIAGKETLEPVLKRFIARHLKEQCDMKPEWPLHYSVPRFPWPKGAGLSEDEAEDTFPEEICIGHAYSLWAELKKREDHVASRPAGSVYSNVHKKGGKGKMRWQV